MAKTYEPIATNTLGSITNSVTFSSIPATYTDLVLIVSATGSGGNASGVIQFNGDTTSQYSTTILYGDGTTAASARPGSEVSMRATYAASIRTTSPNVITVSIQNYANTTTYKTALIRNGNAAAGTDAIVGLWRKTPEAITSIKFFSDNANSYAVGSTFTLYGIKAA